MTEKIKFKDLDWICKIGMISSLIYAGLFIIGFIYGFFGNI